MKISQARFVHTCQLIGNSWNSAIDVAKLSDVDLVTSTDPFPCLLLKVGGIIERVIPASNIVWMTPVHESSSLTRFQDKVTRVVKPPEVSVPDAEIQPASDGPKAAASLGADASLVVKPKPKPKKKAKPKAKKAKKPKSG